MQAWTHVIKS